jgi:coenzyme F420-0:L-glutamate ligase/coenzyme F420-1:gamma-L-glutamate ligase
VEGLPEVRPGDVLADLIGEHASLQDGDVLVITQKIVSKAEGRVVDLGSECGRPPHALVEAESVRVLRRREDLLVTETPHGFVCANAGVDVSNVEPGRASMLPRDPDRSARRVRDGLRATAGVDVGVIVSDTFGRPWRLGVTDVAIGCAGVAAVVDLRGTADRFGRPLEATQVCVADEIAAAADLVMGKTYGVPAAVVRGVDRRWLREGSVKAEAIRHPSSDLFR